MPRARKSTTATTPPTAPTSIDPSRLYTYPEVGHYLNLTADTVFRLVARGEGPRFVTVGKRNRRCRGVDLQKFIDGLVDRDAAE